MAYEAMSINIPLLSPKLLESVESSDALHIPAGHDPLLSGNSVQHPEITEHITRIILNALI